MKARTEIMVALERAGAEMGNVMSNLEQSAGRTLTSEDAACFGKFRRDWDKAHGDYQQINHLTGTPPYDQLAERVASLEAALDEKDASYWTDGEPPFPYNQEWFIAKTIYGEKVVLRALPKEFTYDYKTADETYMAARNIKCWMQFPDSQYKHFKSSTAPQPVEAAKGGEPVAWEVSSMPGTSGFTMAVFKTEEMPVGSKVYATPPAPTVAPSEMTDADIQQIATAAYRAGKLSWLGFDIDPTTGAYGIPILSQCHYQLVRAALAAQTAAAPVMAVPGWKPIETAPQDGYMLVHEDGAIRALFRMNGVWGQVAYPAIISHPWGDVIVGEDAKRFLPAGYRLELRDGCCENPTHWMKLPDLPAAPTTEGGE